MKHLLRLQAYKAHRFLNARRIQCCFRIYLAKCAFIRRRIAMACLVIQCNWRRHIAMGVMKFKRQTNATIKVQKTWRGLVGRRKYQVVLRAFSARVIYQFYRAYKMRMRVRAATVLVLCVRRWYACRCRRASVINRFIRRCYIHRSRHASIIQRYLCLLSSLLGHSSGVLLSYSECRIKCSRSIYVMIMSVMIDGEC